MECTKLAGVICEGVFCSLTVVHAYLHIIKIQLLAFPITLLIVISVQVREIASHLMHDAIVHLIVIAVELAARM